MADLKVSQLPAYPSILSGINDALLIVDSTNTASKKISPQAFVGAFLLTGTIDPTAVPVITPAIYQNTTSETTWIYDGTQWILVSGGGGSESYFIPYVSFVSSATPAVQQTFTSSAFLHYATVTEMTVLVNGAALTPVVSYSLTGATLTILDYLDSNSLIEIIAKTVPGTQTITDISTQSGDLVITQAGDFIILT